MCVCETLSLEGGGGWNEFHANTSLWDENREILFCQQTAKRTFSFCSLIFGTDATMGPAGGLLL